MYFFIQNKNNYFFFRNECLIYSYTSHNQYELPLFRHRHFLNLRVFLEIYRSEYKYNSDTFELINIIIKNNEINFLLLNSKSHENNFKHKNI